MTGPSIADGKAWTDQRRFMLSTLTTLGMGRKETVDAIVETEVESLFQRIRSETQSGQAFKPNGFFLPSTSNVIWRIVTGRRSKHDDPDLKLLITSLSQFFDALAPGSLFYVMQFNNLTFAKICHLLFKDSVAANGIRWHKTLAKEMNGQSADAEGFYIERFLYEIERHASKPESSFHGSDGQMQLLAHLSDLFAAGCILLHLEFDQAIDH